MYTYCFLEHPGLHGVQPVGQEGGAGHGVHADGGPQELAVRVVKLSFQHYQT